MFSIYSNYPPNILYRMEKKGPHLLWLCGSCSETSLVR